MISAKLGFWLISFAIISSGDLAREAKRKALEEKEKEALPLDQRWD